MGPTVYLPEGRSMMDELIARQLFAASGCCIQSTKQLYNDRNVGQHQASEGKQRRL